MWLLKSRRYALVHVRTQSGTLGGMCTYTHTAPEPAHTVCDSIVTHNNGHLLGNAHGTQHSNIWTVNCALLSYV